jgi:hypothetical protein
MHINVTHACLLAKKNKKLIGIFVAKHFEIDDNQ